MLAADRPMTGPVTAQGLDGIERLPSKRALRLIHPADSFVINEPAADVYGDLVLSSDDIATLDRDVEIARSCFRLVPNMQRELKPLRTRPEAARPRSPPVA
jgi:hypothetical protein